MSAKVSPLHNSFSLFYLLSKLFDKMLGYPSWRSGLLLYYELSNIRTQNNFELLVVFIVAIFLCRGQL